MADFETALKPADARVAALTADSGQQNIAIVVIAYNRPHSLERLLASLARADYGGSSRIPLVISIDKSDSDNVARIAADFKWAFGEKSILLQSENIGLKKHLILCGGLTSRYDNVIVLEDDLYVSPHFYPYAQQALDFYHRDDAIAGISLYSHDYNELAQLPFRPLDDGYDNYFMKVPSSWGQLWTKRQWREFSRFYESDEAALNPSDRLSDIIITQWREPSWKKHFYKYLLVKNKYFVYPRTSCTTNFSTVGTHFPKTSNAYQVSLDLIKRKPAFSSFRDSSAKYDAYFEILPEIIKAHNPGLSEYDFECDLYGTRELHKIEKEFLLSAKECARPLASFSVSMVPHELNVCLGITGDYFHLGETADFRPMAPYKSAAHSYYSKILPLNVPQIQADSFNQGVAAVRGSFSYRIGDALLSPLKIMKKMLARGSR